ncbi:M48 family metalloprotease [Stenotrophomonas sp.]|uniref:M48 family metallopeptidase n=1 Tax=Stenotrophomonas sp. TaxID=69392 RepID=UPI0028A97FBF|nr:M48 family metalloprotease [Stenotrophomonas sp.]
MADPAAPGTASAAFRLGLGLPLALAAVAGWQHYRARQWPLDLAHGQDAALYLGPLSLLSLLLGLLAALSFCIAWTMMRRAAHRALQSRDALLQAFGAGRRWLPLFMVLQTLLIFAGLIGLLGFEAGRAIDQSYRSDGAIKLVLLSGLVALLLLWYAARIVWDSLRMALRRPPLEPIQIMGQAVTAQQAPALWEFVGDIARCTHARLPDTVVVGLNEGFFVTEHPVALVNGQQLPAGRVLYLPLPYMSFMHRAEVAAVVAHELGHFSADDTAYGQRFAPIYQSLSDSILAITNEHDANDDGWRAWASAPASLFGKGFLRSFDEAVQHWSRKRELAADAFSTQVGGNLPAATALLRSAVLQGLVEEALAHNRNAPPQQREGVLAMVRRLVDERGLPDPREHLEDHQAHPLDTHPPLRARLQALGISITPELIVRARDTRPTRLLAELGLEAA